MMSSLVINWLLFSISVACLIYLGIRAKRFVRKDGESGFLLAGRSLGTFVGASTVVATGFSGWAFVGSPGMAYQYGTIELLANFMFAPAMVLGVLFFGNYLRRRAEELGSLTIPEYVAVQHADGLTRRFIQGFGALITIGLLLVFLIGQIKALGLLAAPLLGLPMNLAAILLMAVIMVYTTMGGMKAIAWTNGLMAVGMAVGAVMILIAVFDHTSLTDLLSRLSSIDRELVSPSTGTPYGDSRFSAFLVLPYAFLFTMCLPYMASRILAFRKDVTMHDAALIVAILTCILSVTPVAGLYARAYMEPLAEPDQAIIAVINELLGPLARAFIGLFILFAIQTTASSLLHTIGSAASHDLRKALVPEKELPQSRVLFIDRATVLIFGVLAVIGMFYAPPFMLVWLGILGTGSLLASFAVPVFFSSFWLGNGYGTLAAMLSGLTVSAAMLLYFESGWIEGPLLGCVISAVAYYLVSVATFSRQPRRA